MKFFWSRQHGAYITVIIGWLYAILRGGDFNWIHPVLLIWVLAGLHVTELGSMWVKSGKVKFKPYFPIFWIYLILTAAGLATVLLILPEPELPVFFLLVLGMVTALLFASRLQKTLPAEWLIFSAFTLIPFLGSPWMLNRHYSQLFIEWLPVGLYFCMTPVLLKIRIREIKRWGIIPYVLIAGGFLVYLGTIPAILMAGLILVKGILVFLFIEKYVRLKIPTIGWIETVLAAGILGIAAFS